MATLPSEQYVKKDALRRIISDIKELRKNPLTGHGIHYEHDETDMLKGRALIIGPADTPYADGFYLFKFQFPANYPHEPPKVEFCTGDGYTRFNPNLYRTGKVCLSILNTWKGEPWSGCQTISSVLLAICTVLNDEPLLNEPGITKTHRDFDSYNAILKYKNIEVAIFGMLAGMAGVYAPTNDVSGVMIASASDFAVFGDIMREHFRLNKEKIRQRIEDAIAVQIFVPQHSMSIYKMSVVTDYNVVLIKLDSF
jgi:ubiquitin-protein ligase